MIENSINILLFLGQNDKDIQISIILAVLDALRCPGFSYGCNEITFSQELHSFIKII